MATRLEIARARARVALARKTGEQLPAEVLARAALEFGAANEEVESRRPARQTRSRVRVAAARVWIALCALSGQASSGRVAEEAALRSSRMKISASRAHQGPVPGRDALPRAYLATQDYRGIAGVHAHGRDFGPLHQLGRDSAGRQLTPDEEAVLIDGQTITRESLERAQAAVNRGELDAEQRRSRQPGLVATMSSLEVEDWLEIGSAKRGWMLSVGELFAFVADDELRYPTWQFCDDDEQPIVPHLSRLAPAFDGMHPASILRFMTTPRDRLTLEGEPVSPIDWLLHDGEVRVLVEMLYMQLMS